MSISVAKYSLIAVLILFVQHVEAQVKASSNLLDHLVSFGETSSVTGREAQSSAYIESLFNDGELTKDKLGNLILTIGSGQPKRLIAAPLDEPGYVISKIQEDGYLRIAIVGSGHEGNLFHQFLEGHEVVIITAEGPVIGVATVPSAHFERVRKTPQRSKGPLSWQEVYLDVGVSNAQAVALKGIQLLDPVTLNKKVSVIDDKYIAAPAMKSKAAAIALAQVAKSIAPGDISGSLVITWHTLQLINQQGWKAVANRFGEFEEISLFKPELAIDSVANAPTGTSAKLIDEFNVSEIGLPGAYASTPVEMVALQDIENLIDYWTVFAGAKPESGALPKFEPKPKPDNTASHAFPELAALTAELVATYGVSGAEENVRKLILQKLPPWASPEVDEKGNVLLHLGQGNDHIVFVAHMDETGYVVDDIKDNGALVLKMRGGMLQWVWEAQPAIVHGSNGMIHGVFEPRADYLTADGRDTSAPLTVFAGFESKREAEDAGILIGVTTVTMPKEMIRLSENRVTARGFDDRVGSAALLLSLENMNPAALTKRVTYVWSVEEEIGLHGATFAAESLKDATVVYPIDTYVSSDDPYQDEYLAHCPLGEGAVIRVLESINFISRENLTAMRLLAKENQIEVQYGMTAGGTDGQAFLAYGIPSVPLSWPGRYSHSPVEIMDFRDMENLVRLIQAVVKN
tara:strand:- start:62 stop:2122 length:2061 start_codon:yes stop_codon:yes gene_type:complete